MRNTFGGQQGDNWLRNRCGRITASRIKDVCAYVQKGSQKRGDKSVKSGADRTNYRKELICERLTGRCAEHYNSGAMQRGTGLEPDARMYYESALRVMVLPVNFVLHPQYDFTGASPDGLVGNEGMVEIKCLLPWNHLEEIDTREITPERFAQVGWQLACGGKERRWNDLVHYCPDIKGCDKKRFRYQRIGRDELEWEVPSIQDGKLTYRKLTGEDVIHYFTSEVLKFNAEIDFYMAENEAKPVAPFPVELITEDGEVIDSDPEAEPFPADMNDPTYDFLGHEVTP